MIRPQNVLILLPFLITSASALADAPSVVWAEDGSFDWPMGLTLNGTRVMGYGTYVLQNYGNVNPYYDDRQHSALDIAYLDGGAATANAPVFAASDGTVLCSEYVNYPGDIVVLQHDLPDGTVVYSMYGHLGSRQVSVGQTVTRGRQVGTVLSWPDDVSNTHVHFEIRNWGYYSSGNCYGPGYATSGQSPDTQGWRDPAEYYYTHRPLFPAAVVTTPAWTINVRSGPSTNYGIISTLAASSSVTGLAVVPDESGQNNWWYEVQYDATHTGYAAGFVWDGWSSYINIGESKREGEGGDGSGCGAATRIPASRNSSSGAWLGLIPACGLLWRLRRKLRVRQR